MRELNKLELVAASGGFRSEYSMKNILLRIGNGVVYGVFGAVTLGFLGLNTSLFTAAISKEIFTISTIIPFLFRTTGISAVVGGGLGFLTGVFIQP